MVLLKQTTLSKYIVSGPALGKRLEMKNHKSESSNTQVSGNKVNLNLGDSSKKMSECRVLLTRCDSPTFPGTKSKDFNCQLCQKKYVSKLYLQTHIQRVHEKHRDHKCSFCSYESFTKGQLQRHSTTHTKEKTNICSICGLRTPTLENIYNHEHTHFQSKYYTMSITRDEYRKSGRKLQPNFSCKSCDKKFPDFQSISEHITPFVQCLKCNNCGSDFASQSDQENHKNQTVEDLECKFCHQLFNNSCQFTKHELDHLGAFLTTKKCPEFSVSISSVAGLKKHFQTKHLSEIAVKNQCLECKLILKSKMLLELHKQVYHSTSGNSDIDSSDDDNDDDSSGKCHICGDDFTRKVGRKMSRALGYARHVMKKHTAFEDVKYGCILCGKRFQTNDPGLSGHVQRHFMDDISKPKVDLNRTKKFKAQRRHQCKLCGKSVHGLPQHMRRHLKERSHKCEECGKSWVNNEDLKKHLKSHSKVKKYPCQFCGKSFGIGENRRRHEKTVHSETRVSCKICAKTFSHHNYLKDHLMVHNENKEFKCKFCGKGYQSRPNMYRHIRETHPSSVE